MIEVYRCEACLKIHDTKKECMDCEKEHAKWKDFEAVFVDQSVYEEIVDRDKKVSAKGFSVKFGDDDLAGYVFYLKDIESISKTNPYVSYMTGQSLPYLEALEE